MTVAKFKTLALTVLITIGLAGCVTTGDSKQATGTAVGATAGAALGALIADNSGQNAWVGALIGGMAGGLIGNAIGAALDEQERKAMAAATKRALEAEPNKKVAWKAPAKPAKTTTSGSTTKAEPTTGYVVAGEVFTNASGQQCRNVDQVANKDGQRYQGQVTACKTSSGWSEAV
ncbi:glycine zipper domain-containing protein [Thiohalocapsa marina]